jgi:hypothetical protein
MRTSIITDTDGTRLIVDAESEIERNLFRELNGQVVAIKMNGSQFVIRRADAEERRTAGQVCDEADSAIADGIPLVFGQCPSCHGINRHEQSCTRR